RLASRVIAAGDCVRRSVERRQIFAAQHAGAAEILCQSQPNTWPHPRDQFLPRQQRLRAGGSSRLRLRPRLQREKGRVETTDGVLPETNLAIAGYSLTAGQQTRAER